MAKAKSGDGMVGVKFVGLPGPPARLVADEVVIEAGDVGRLPEALARELAANSQVGLVLTDEEPTEPVAEEPEPEIKDGQVVLQHENPPEAEKE